MAVDIDETEAEHNEFTLWLARILAAALGMLSDYPPPVLRIGSIDLCFTRVIIPGIPGRLLGLDAMVVPQAADKWDVVLVDGRAAAPAGYGRASDFPGGGRFIFRNSRGTAFGDRVSAHPVEWAGREGMQQLTLGVRLDRYRYTRGEGFSSN